MIDAILADVEVITAFVVVTAALMRWVAWRLDKQQETHKQNMKKERLLFEQELQQSDQHFQAQLERQRQQHEVSLMATRTENLQQRAIADSIYNNVAVNTAAINAIQTLAENRNNDHDLKQNLQKFVMMIERGNRQNTELLEIAREFQRRHSNDSDNASGTNHSRVFGDAG